ncbi:hypothetical protein OS493_027982 [Desmophyllum pertusum]|uniref:Uncharacterized protein n=1 Tax=Desmophyllum pertusum TaxID=174260 RepID=A0A9X0CD11_9CNID|nr:hypothetical protein OS493_027982 [Desmophyllum pertusum]
MVKRALLQRVTMESSAYIPWSKPTAEQRETLLNMVDECTELYKKCCDISEAYAEKKRHADSLNYFGFRRLRDVEDLKDHQGTLDIFQEAYRMREGEDERGRELIHEGINIRVKLGVSLYVAHGYAYLGCTYRHCGEFQEAIKLWTTETLPVFREELGEHPWTASNLYYLADSHKALANGISGEDTDKAMRYVKEALKMQKSLMGIHRDTARSHVCLSDVLRIQGKWKLALKELEKGLEIQTDVFGPDHEENNRHTEQDGRGAGDNGTGKKHRRAKITM